MGAVITQNPASLGGTGCSGCSPPQWGAQSTWSIISSHCSPWDRSAVRLTHQKENNLKAGNNFLSLYEFHGLKRGLSSWKIILLGTERQQIMAAPCEAINLPMAPPLRGAVRAHTCSSSSSLGRALGWEGGGEGVQIWLALIAAGSWVSDWRQDYLKDSLYSQRY